jgi:hypothetical protein
MKNNGEWRFGQWEGDPSPHHSFITVSADRDSALERISDSCSHVPTYKNVPQLPLVS